MQALTPALPPAFAAWFADRGWTPHAHQLTLLACAEAEESALLIAPTGGGKTLAGFLPSLVELAGSAGAGGAGGGDGRGLHTLYISPLKALTTDIARNLEAPINEMALPLRVETRTGDTPANRRARQRKTPPDILLTTPESLALLLSYEDAAEQFRHLRCVIIDELHALAETKRGQLLSLALARLGRLSARARFVGLSATVHDPERLQGFLAVNAKPVRVVRGAAGAQPEVRLLLPRARIPWAGHSAAYAMPALYAELCRGGTSLVFVNTRAQAEIAFQHLWRLNARHLGIALHHGSLAQEQRRKVEAAMSQGGLDVVVCTSSLDLGIDWGAVARIAQIGAPKGVARLLQRIGRANHRLDQPSRALLVPGNRFEVLECVAALRALDSGRLDGDPPLTGGLDVLAQHIIGTACGGPFAPGALYDEVRRAAPYRDLERATFDAVLAFATDGGYALRAYERFKRLHHGSDGRVHLVNARFARAYRMNVGTIVAAPTLKVRFAGPRGRGGYLGEVEESFIATLRPGDTFLFAGQVVAYQRIKDSWVEVAPAGADAEPMVPAYVGAKLPLSTFLADTVRALLAEPARWAALPYQLRTWLSKQTELSELPRADQLLVETFPRGERFYLVAYPFAGRNAHQSLGMLLTKRLARQGAEPLGFVATDYAIAAYAGRPLRDVAGLFALDILGDDLEEWLAESVMLKRTFRNVAVTAGLIEKNLPGHEKTGRQVTVNSDLIYDVLRKYQPDHVLLEAARREADAGLIDLERLKDLLTGIAGRIRHRDLPRCSPMALPMLAEIGRERVGGAEPEDIDALLAEVALDDLDVIAPDEAPGGIAPEEAR